MVSTQGKHTLLAAAGGAEYKMAWMMTGPYCHKLTVRKAQKCTYDKLRYIISLASVSAAGKAINEEGVQIEPVANVASLCEHLFSLAVCTSMST